MTQTSDQPITFGRKLNGQPAILPPGFRLSLDHLYVMPGYAIPRHKEFGLPPFGFNGLAKLIEAYKRDLRVQFPGASDLDLASKLPIEMRPTHRQLLSSMEMYNRASTEAPGYPPYLAERWIIDKYIGLISQYTHGANLFELCAGTGYKTAEVARRMGGEARWAKYLPNDLYGANCRAAGKNVGEVFDLHAAPELDETLCGDRIDAAEREGFVTMHEDVIPIPGDIYRGTTWEKGQILAAYREAKIDACLPFRRNVLEWLATDAAPTVTLELGAHAFNNTTIEQMKQLLSFYRDCFKPGTVHLVAVDFTNKTEALQPSYGDYTFNQLFYTAGIYQLCLGISGFDPLSVECRMNYTEGEFWTSVQAEICEVGGGKSIFFDPINKINRGFLHGMVHCYNLEILEPAMNYEDDSFPGVGYSLMALRSKPVGPPVRMPAGKGLT